MTLPLLHFLQLKQFSLWFELSRQVPFSHFSHLDLVFNSGHFSFNLNPIVENRRTKDRTKSSMKAEQRVSLKKTHPVATHYPQLTVLNVNSFGPLQDKCSSNQKTQQSQHSLKGYTLCTSVTQSLYLNLLYLDDIYHSRIPYYSSIHYQDKFFSHLQNLILYMTG